MAARAAVHAHTSHNHRACIEDALATARALCAERGVQLTPLREKVLQIVWKSHKPVGAYEVLDELAQTHKSARPPTVYRALDFLMAEGLIHKIESLNAYLGCIEAIVDAKLEAALAAAAARAHFRPERKVVEISGLCARCGK